jgi:hypothetical protein
LQRSARLPACIFAQTPCSYSFFINQGTDDWSTSTSGLLPLERDSSSIFLYQQNQNASVSHNIWQVHTISNRSIEDFKINKRSI